MESEIFFIRFVLVRIRFIFGHLLLACRGAVDDNNNNHFVVGFFFFKSNERQHCKRQNWSLYFCCLWVSGCVRLWVNHNDF